LALFSTPDTLAALANDAVEPTHVAFTARHVYRPAGYTEATEAHNPVLASARSIGWLGAAGILGGFIRAVPATWLNIGIITLLYDGVVPDAFPAVAAPGVLEALRSRHRLALPAVKDQDVI
jgi:hypothetical protein